MALGGRSLALGAALLAVAFPGRVLGNEPLPDAALATEACEASEGAGPGTACGQEGALPARSGASGPPGMEPSSLAQTLEPKDGGKTADTFTVKDLKKLAKLAEDKEGFKVLPDVKAVLPSEFTPGLLGTKVFQETDKGHEKALFANACVEIVSSFEIPKQSKTDQLMLAFVGGEGSGKRRFFEAVFPKRKKTDSSWEGTDGAEVSVFDIHPSHEERLKTSDAFLVFLTGQETDQVQKQIEEQVNLTVKGKRVLAVMLKQ